jgi:hypothetical protein
MRVYQETPSFVIQKDNLVLQKDDHPTPAQCLSRITNRIVAKHGRVDAQATSAPLIPSLLQVLFGQFSTIYKLDMIQIPKSK